jgi:hypothetical protein
VAVVEERQLLKTLRWYDGFVIALANPGFLLGSLGFSVGDLGGWGAAMLWGISAVVAVFINTIYSELATMFPEKSGGLALYAHEAWRKYTTLVGPIATFGYWIGWSVVLSVNGLFIGSIIQGTWFSGEPGSYLADDGYLRSLGSPSSAYRPRSRSFSSSASGCSTSSGPALACSSATSPRDPDGAAVRDDDPAVPERQLRQRCQPDEQAQRSRPGRGADSSCARLVVADVLVGVGRRRLCHLRSRVQGTPFATPCLRSARCSRWWSTSCSITFVGGAGARMWRGTYGWAG